MISNFIWIPNMYAMYMVFMNFVYMLLKFKDAFNNGKFHS